MSNFFADIPQGRAAMVLAGTWYDELLPMAYHRMLGRGASWISDTVEETRRVGAGARVLPVVQLSAEARFAGDSDWGAQLEVGEHDTVISAAMAATQGEGFVVFPGEATLLGSATQQTRQALTKAVAVSPDS